MEKRILGIDPGSHRLGLGCIQKLGNNYRLISATVIEAPARDSLYPRLGLIAQRLEEILDEWAPHEVAVEDLFQAKNARSAFHLGMARGVAIAACLRRQLEIFEYAPTQVKFTVAGHGRADKEQVKKMVQLSMGVTLDLGYDATDAIAVAICHANFRRIKFT